ncbi:MAG TPA: alpha/beta fold hydrolase [Firmicutes bacterium]|nr:alpha/beta fold hydrolase [Bacillota bacterium]
MWTKHGYRWQLIKRCAAVMAAVTAPIIIIIMITAGGTQAAYAEEAAHAALSPTVAGAAARAAELFAAGKYQELWEMGAPVLQAAITVAQLQAIGDRLGAVQAVGRPQAVPGYPQTAIVVLTYPAFKVDLTLTVDEEGKLIGLFVRPHEEQLQPGCSAASSSADGADAEESWEAPPYVVAGTFAERTTTFGTPGWELEGTFTYPTDRAEYPAVVLVHGSGPNDRDETLGPNRIFRDLAWGLASRGIAVFRYDKRTYVHGGKMTPADVTPYSEVIDDARAAIAWVKRQPGVSRVYLVGHSLGAQLAPAIAEGLPPGTLAGLVLLAVPARPLEELVVYQVQYLAQIDGTVTDDEKQAIAQLEMAVQALTAGQLPADADFLGAPVHYWVKLRELSPVPIARRLELPLLLVQGGRDYQVPPAEFEEWKKELGGRGNVDFELFPDLNHLLIPGAGPSTPQEYEKPGHVAEEVIEAIARFAGWANNG